MKKFISLLLAAALTLAFAPMCFAYEPDKKLISSKAIIMNLDSENSVLYQKDADIHTQPSTLTKIMTAVLAIESCDDVSAKTVTASYAGVHALDGKFATYYGIKAGEKYSMLDLINIMMYCSANDAANVIAVQVSGSVNSFVNKMNEKVKKLNLKNTFFLNPTGLDADGQYTTARDMAKITKYAMSLPVFQQISKGVSYTVKKNTTHKGAEIYNDCELIPTSYYNKYSYEYATGVKSGATEATGYCVAATASKDGMNYVCIVMGGKKTYIDGTEYTSALVDARRLFKWVFSSFKVKVITTESTIVAEVPVKLASGADHVSLVPQKTITDLVPSNVDASTVIIKPVNIPKSLKAPIKKGDYVCKAKVIHAGEEIMEIKLVAYEDVNSSGIKYVADFLKSIFANPIALIILVLLIAGAGFYAVHNIRRKKIRKRQRDRAIRQSKLNGENKDE